MNMRPAGRLVPFLPGLSLTEAKAAADARQVEDAYLDRNGAETSVELAEICPPRLMDAVLERIREARERRRKTVKRAECPSA